jgi:hypothetical protein
MEHYYHHLEDIFPEADLPPFAFPQPAAWPSPRSPVHLPPPRPALACSSLPHTSSTRSYPTALGRQGPEPNLLTRGQAPHRSDQGLYECSEKKKDGTTCRQTFKRSKDLTRHLKTLHPSKDAKKSVCRCGKSDYRRDNHTRHVEKCKFAVKTAPFKCSQGHEYHSRAAYLNHLRDECRQL